MNPVGEWSLTLLSAFADVGVRRVVLSPGSRSTPLVWAATQCEKISVVDVVDERDAAFVALGCAKATGKPALLVCTSGSALTHYFPAIAEAAQSFTPLLVLSADRPFSLQRCGANQTLDQTKPFGEYARFFLDLGLPEVTGPSLRALRRHVARAAAVASYPVPGPVHLNARFDKPLEPRPASSAEAPFAELARKVRSTPNVTISAPQRLPADSDLVAITDALQVAKRPILLAGPASLQAVDREATFALARRAGLPVFAEAASQLRFAGHQKGVVPLDIFDPVLESADVSTELGIDFVLQLGATPVSAGVDRWLSNASSLRRIVVSEHGHPDPWGTAERVVQAPVGETAARAAARLDFAIHRGPWLDLAQAVARRVAAVADEEADAAEGLSEATVARTLFARLPLASTVFLGNSLPIRIVDRWVSGRGQDLRVLSQRGTSGIDGLVAGAVGAALTSEQPVALLLGDISLLHDVGGLLSTRLVDTSLVIVVLNNDGGRIFDRLPVAGMDEYAERAQHWTTPHGRSFEAVASFYGIAHRCVSARKPLDKALDDALHINGPFLIEAVVPPRDVSVRDAVLDQKVAAATLRVLR